MDFLSADSLPWLREAQTAHARALAARAGCRIRCCFC